MMPIMEGIKVAATGYYFGPAHAAIQRYVDGDLLSGFSSAVLVGRDLVDVQCIGWADKEAQIPLRVDHIFRVFSNTKLVTSCAALLLFDEGHFQLDDPIDRYIPQLANRPVLRPDATSLDQTEPALGPITIRHLMSHSSGLSYGLFDPGTLMFKAYSERKIVNPATTLAEMVDALAGLPLAFLPGTSWEYSVSTDVLARLVEVISGQRFGAFIQSRILDPLGMVDTGFVVSDRDRLVAHYTSADMTNPMKPGLTRTDDAPYPGAYLRPFAEAERRERIGLNVAGHGGANSKLASGRTDITEAGHDQTDDDEPIAKGRVATLRRFRRTSRKGARACRRTDRGAFRVRASGRERRDILGRTWRDPMVDLAGKRHCRLNHGFT